MGDWSWKTLQAADRATIWHPYASATDAAEVVPVTGAAGVHLQLADGKRLLDGMSSWWCAIHGYNHPALNRAVRDQLGQMSHVMFGGLTHPPAVKLAQLLTRLTPASLNRVFFSDSGSVAVERTSAWGPTWPAARSRWSSRNCATGFPISP